MLNKLKERVGLSYDHFMGVQKVVLVEQIDELIKELIKNDATRND